MQRFEKETGIRRREWLGVLWARWGDALVEAGFSPNPRQERFDQDLLLKKLAEAVRYYGKVPTDAELRMYKRQVDADFPAHTTPYSHFGTKAATLARLRQWADGNHGYADVAAMLPHKATPPRTRSAGVPLEGSVYLLQSGAHYKIGRSDELERRIKEITIALPEAVTLVHTIRTDDPAGIEAYWHRRFAERRAKGEWFKLTPSDVAAFKRRKYQ